MPVLFIVFDALFKLMPLDPVSDSWVQLGQAVDPALVIDLLDLAGVILYFIPRTSALGALVLTGHLGGTLATHVGAPGPTTTHILFPVYVAALLWGGLLLRKARWRMLILFMPDASALPKSSRGRQAAMGV